MAVVPADAGLLSIELRQQDLPSYSKGSCLYCWKSVSRILQDSSMNAFRSALVFQAVFLVLVSGVGCRRAQERPGLTRSAQMAGDLNFPEKFAFTVGQDDYIVLKNGTGQRLGRGNAPLSFSLQTEQGFLEDLRFFTWEGDLLLIYEVNYGGEGWGKVVRLDGRSLKPKWLAHIPGFNIGQGLVSRGFVYLTAIGFVAKLDLATGRYAWKLEDLYESRPEAFNNFDSPPKVENGTVIFREETGKTLRVEDATGRIISKG
jgi:hypothetical protein